MARHQEITLLRAENTSLREENASLRDSNRILELLRMAAEQAENVSEHQKGLLERQEEAACVFSVQLQESARVAEDERASLLAAREEFAVLREAEVTRS